MTTHHGIFLVMTRLLAPKKSHQQWSTGQGEEEVERWHLSLPLKSLITFIAMLIGNSKMIETMAVFLPVTPKPFQGILQAHFPYTCAPCSLNSSRRITIPLRPHSHMAHHHVAARCSCMTSALQDPPSENSHSRLRPRPIHKWAHGGIVALNARPRLSHIMFTEVTRKNKRVRWMLKLG